MLGQEEIKRRIDAARTLRGMTQSHLAELLHADGFGKHDLGRIERGDLPLRRNMTDALCRHLGVPVAWFEAADTAAIFGTADPLEGVNLPELARQVAELHQLALGWSERFAASGLPTPPGELARRLAEAARNERDPQQDETRGERDAQPTNG